MNFDLSAPESKASKILIIIGFYIALVSGITNNGEAMVLAIFLMFAGFVPFSESPIPSMFLGVAAAACVFFFARNDLGLFIIVAGLYAWLWRHAPIAINLAIAVVVAVFLIKGYPVLNDAPVVGPFSSQEPIPSEAYMEGRKVIALCSLGCLFAIVIERWWRKRDDPNV